MVPQLLSSEGLRIDPSQFLCAVGTQKSSTVVVVAAVVLAVSRASLSPICRLRSHMRKNLPEGHAPIRRQAVLHTLHGETPRKVPRFLLPCARSSRGLQCGTWYMQIKLFALHDQEKLTSWCRPQKFWGDSSPHL